MNTIEKKIEKLVTMMDCETAFAEPGSDSIIDVINPENGRSWIQGENLEEIRKRYPTAEIVNIEEHCKAKAARQDTPIEWTETTEEKYYEMLEVLPPAAWIGGGFLVGEPWDHHATSGRPRFAAYRKRGATYYEASRPLTIPEFKHEVTTRSLIAAAAEASEVIGDDELERFAGSIQQ